VLFRWLVSLLNCTPDLGEIEYYKDPATATPTLMNLYFVAHPRARDQVTEANGVVVRNPTGLRVLVTKPWEATEIWTFCSFKECVWIWVL